MSEVFEGYERQYCELYAKFSRKCSHLVFFLMESTTWTNVKHNSYLASLEASFVKELHQSLGLPSSHSEYSDQFTVLQDGFSRRINSERSQPLPYNAAGSHFVKESSWMQRFRCSGKHDNISVNLRECSTFCSEEMLSGRKRIFTHRLRTAMRTP